VPSGGAGKPRVRTRPDNWQEPRKWNRKAERDGKRIKVFCASLADVFDSEVEDSWRSDLWRLIEQTPNLDWLLLTKRTASVAGMVPWGDT
jgi:protein gp37